MSKIPDFSDSQIWTVESTLKERYPDSPVDHVLQEQEEVGSESGQ